jgi:hypothetical protein
MEDRRKQKEDKDLQNRLKTGAGHKATIETFVDRATHAYSTKVVEVEVSDVTSRPGIGQRGYCEGK